MRQEIRLVKLTKGDDLNVFSEQNNKFKSINGQYCTDTDNHDENGMKEGDNITCSRSGENSYNI